MESLVYSDFFLLVLGLSQIFIAVFLIFILGLLIKIFSDVSDIIKKIKRETDEVIEDVSHLRHELKGTIKSTSGYLKVLISATGVRKIISLLSGFMEKEEKPKKKRRTKKD